MHLHFDEIFSKHLDCGSFKIKEAGYHHVKCENMYAPSYLISTYCEEVLSKVKRNQCNAMQLFFNFIASLRNTWKT